MKNRWYAGTFLMIAGFVGILILSTMIGNASVVTLPQVFPEIGSAENFQGEIFQDGADGGIPLLLTDEQFKSCLSAAQLKEKDPFDTHSSPEMKLKFSARGREFSAVIGGDGKIRVEKCGDPASAVHFFTDRTLSLYRSLYEEHLLSGGQEVPKEKR